MSKESSEAMAKLAAKVLGDKRSTPTAKKLAGSVLSQYEEEKQNPQPDPAMAPMDPVTQPADDTIAQPSTGLTGDEVIRPIPRAQRATPFVERGRAIQDFAETIMESNERVLQGDGRIRAVPEANMGTDRTFARGVWAGFFRRRSR